MSAVAPSWSLTGPAARATRLCLRSQLAVWGWFWFTLVVVGIGVAAAALRFDVLELSAWGYLSTATRWFAFAMLVFVTAGAAGPFVANGLTRRAFVRVLAAVLVVTAAAFAVLWTAGHAVETAVFRSRGWPTAVEGHLYADGAQLGLVALEALLAMLAYGASGALVGAGYYRGGGWSGTLALPLTLLPVAVAQLLLSGGWSLGSLELAAGVAVPLRALGALLAAVLGLVAVHLVLRRVPLRRPTT
ncbi:MULTISPECIES: hypothetical protein [unclassified Actinotalea]|uniref:hypothetical protein n=1 Tax=unclassified Actinotalea TaxID=2638618 RepID=UPI0015F71213|nr:MULTISPECIES: hypothetical protein [unclassified Actinotalea]